MSKRPSRASAAQGPGLWDSRIQALVSRWALAIALCCLVIGGLRIASTWRQLGLTFDEPQHYACGLQYLSRHVYTYEPQHPPLARVMTAVLPYLAGVRTSGNPDREAEGVGLLINSSNPDGMLECMRAGILPFFFLGGMVVFYWTRHVFGAAAAALAVLLYSLIPPVLAHGGLATTDMALAACLTWAFYSLVRWAEAPSPRRGVMLGVATAAAVLSKFTTLAFFPMAAIFALLFWYLAARPDGATVARLARERAASFGIAIATGAFLIWAMYFFSFSGVPAPALFTGIGDVLKHNAEGHPSYLLGQNGTRGWWYYFPVALSVKTPLAILLLCGFGICISVKSRQVGALMPLAFAAGILLPAMLGNVNIGVRHILPVYLAMAMLAGAGLVRLAQKNAFVAAFMVLWTALSGGISHPDYLAYFNEFALGDPESFLVDSDLDWGQSTKPLAARLKQLGATQVKSESATAAARISRLGLAFPRSRPSIRRSPRRGGPP